MEKRKEIDIVESRKGERKRIETCKREEKGERIQKMVEKEREKKKLDRKNLRVRRIKERKRTNR